MTNFKRVVKLCAVVLYFLVGLLFYRFYEGWTFIDSLLFTIVTISTVGYGNTSPSDDISRLFTIFYMLFGIYLVLHSLVNFTNSLLERESVAVEPIRNSPKSKIFFVSLAICFCMTTGIIFLMLSEDWSFITAMYFAVETSTVSPYKFNACCG